MPPKRRRRASPLPEAQAANDSLHGTVETDVISLSSRAPSTSRGSSVVVTGDAVAPSRRIPKARQVRGGARGRGRGRGSSRAAEPEPEVPQGYLEMVDVAMAEEAAAEAANEAVEPARKRPKRRRGYSTEPDVVEAGPSRDAMKATPMKAANKGKAKETVVVEPDDPTMMMGLDEDSSDESSDEDEDWEDVDLGSFKAPRHSFEDQGPVEFVLDADDKKRGVERAKITAVDRKIRLEIHKLHIMCLTYFVANRSTWCDLWNLQMFLEQYIDPKDREKLIDNPEQKQFTRHQFFLEGLRGVVDTFSESFKITRPGLFQVGWSSKWRDRAAMKSLPYPIHGDLAVMTQQDFIRAASKFEGSRDVGAQLFCALLRSIGVTTRLVCSLQVLPFGFSRKSASTADSDPGSSDSDSDLPNTFDEDPKPRKLKSGGLRILEKALKPHHRQRRPVTPKRPAVEDPSHPVFWVEAFSPSQQKWVPVDPLVTKSVGKPSALAPPSSSPDNTLSYVFAFESKPLHLVDVTRRYAPWYNAKTLKFRVDSTRHGASFLASLKSIFHRRGIDGRELQHDRDQIEEAELLGKVEKEPLPQNMSDFRGHPVYALKRFLKRNEVVWPNRKVTTFMSRGKAAMKEEVYPRGNVLICRTVEQWYRLGRIVKPGQKSRKTLPPARHPKRRREEDENVVPQERELFSANQTELYIPPPVENGIIPRNRYGNLDIYVPSMVPGGGVHIAHADAAMAARIVGVDYADVVTGFKFTGRQGKAVINGVVVAREYRDAVESVIQGIEETRREEATEERRREAVERWGRFLGRLRIRKRLGMLDREDDDEGLGGERFGGDSRGFVPDPTPDAAREPAEDLGGGFLPEEGGGFAPGPSRPQNEDGDGGGGGFIPDDENSGGGFIPEDEHEQDIELPDANTADDDEEEEDWDMEYEET